MSELLQLISTDFDGTLHDDFSEPRAPREVFEILRRFQKRGGTWVVNTGRTLESILAALQELNLPSMPDYLVVVEREVHVLKGFSYQEVTDWNEPCRRDHDQLSARMADRVESVSQSIREQFDAFVAGDPWSPIGITARSAEDARQIERVIESAFSDVEELALMGNDIYARTCHRAYHKGSALRHICMKLGVEPAFVACFGDNINDLPMLQPSVAMTLGCPANALSEVKEAVLGYGGKVAGEVAGQGTYEILSTLPLL